VVEACELHAVSSKIMPTRPAHGDESPPTHLRSDLLSDWPPSGQPEWAVQHAEGTGVPNLLDSGATHHK
jgi:hypothetical protein